MTASMSEKERKAYPKPGPVGGKLIRRVIRLLRDFQLELPLSSHILIGVSGGSDSIALALLLAKYGRRVVDPSRLSLLHINHGWRGKESDQDALFVRRFGKQLKLPVVVKKLKGPPLGSSGESWENEARKARKALFAQEAARLKGLILSAHHADDLAETLVWRIFTGSAQTHGGGISVRNGFEIRPLLTIRKNELLEFLKEEGQDWREDSTNHEGRFLRARMRQELMPVVEKFFPKGVEHLMELGLRSQMESQSPSPPSKPLALASGIEALFGTLGGVGIRVRRSHLEWVSSKMNETTLPWEGECDLPEGWKLAGERYKVSKGDQTQIIERWLLERTKSLVFSRKRRLSPGSKD